MPSTIEDKVGQMLMVGFHGLEAPGYILEWLRTGYIGGVYLFARNIHSPEQVIALTGQLHQAAKYPILIGIDQEGGMVARLREGFTESPGAMALSASGNPAFAEEISAILAEEMQGLGINWTFAPSVDLLHTFANPSLSTRSFGFDPNLVSDMAAAAVRGFQTNGVAATAKHFPGLGNTPIDTHQSLAVLNTPLTNLRENDLVPYRSVIHENVASIMTTHTKFLALDTEHPATLSPIIIQKLLRDELQFSGVVCTDCMEMRAITNHYGAGESAVLAALAGNDLVMVSHTRALQEEAHAALLDAATSGRLSEEVLDTANQRILQMKERFELQQDRVGISRIRSQAHVETSLKVARAGTILLKNDPHVFPLRQDTQNICLIEFASYMDTEAVERGVKTSLGSVLTNALPQIESVALKIFEASPEEHTSAYQLAAHCDVLLLATRNAHLYPGQLTIAKELVERAKNVILICLRNPYDAVLLDVGTVLCTCGDATPSIQAAVSALLGEFTPMGQLPVELTV